MKGKFDIGKAVLVSDAPDFCAECPLCEDSPEGYGHVRYCWGHGGYNTKKYIPGNWDDHHKCRAEFCPLVIIKSDETYQVFVGNDSVTTTEDRPLEEIVYEIEKAYELLKLNLDILKKHPECPSVRLMVRSADSWLRRVMEEIDNAGGGEA